MVIKKQIFSKNSSWHHWMSDGQFLQFPKGGGIGHSQVVQIKLATGEQTAVLIDGRELGLNFTEITPSTSRKKDGPGLHLR